MRVACLHQKTALESGCSGSAALEGGANAVKAVVEKAAYMVLGLGDVYLGAPCAVPVDPRLAAPAVPSNNPAAAIGTVAGFTVLVKAGRSMAADVVSMCTCLSIFFRLYKMPMQAKQPLSPLRSTCLKGDVRWNDSCCPWKQALLLAVRWPA